MVVALNQKSVAAQPAGPGIARQGLLSDENVKGTDVLLDRLTLKAGASVRFEPSAKSLGWLQLLEGEATLESGYTDRISDSHCAFLPPGFGVTLSTGAGTSLLYAEVLDATRLDPDFPTTAPDRKSVV